MSHINMVRLVPKKIDEKYGTLTPAEIQATMLFDQLLQRGMPSTGIDLFKQALAKGSVDGAMLYAELSNVVFEPFTITDKEAAVLGIIAL